MRNLSIGVLLIAGGTVAALPFRRYQTIHDASLQPTQATGPTQSALGSIELEMMVQQASDGMNVKSLALKPQPQWSHPGGIVRPLEHPPHYGEVAVPIDLSADMQAFNAAVSDDGPATSPASRPATNVTRPESRDIIESAQTEQDEQRVVKPLMETFAIDSSNQQSGPGLVAGNPWNASRSVLIGDLHGAEYSHGAVAARVSQPHSAKTRSGNVRSENARSEKTRRHPTASAVLASSLQAESTVMKRLVPSPNVKSEAIDERLPATSSPRREHHWIRQPD